MAGNDFSSLLSDGEWQVLRGIEARLTTNDPRLARRLDRLRPSLALSVVVCLAFCLALVGAVLAVTTPATSVGWGYAGLALISLSFGVGLFGIHRGA